MASINHIVGVKRILQNLKTKTGKTQAGMIRGLKQAGLVLQRASQRLVPVEDGVLKASAYTRAKGNGWKTVVYVGYTAHYALYVHEQVGMVLKGQRRTSGKGRYWDPQGRAQAKFLEAPARQLRSDLKGIIKMNMK